nr:hypothetical protein [uncultured Desulfobulbus sp.]
MANVNKLQLSIWIFIALVGWGLGAPMDRAQALVEAEKGTAQPQPLIDLDRVGDPFAQFNAPRETIQSEAVQRNPFAATEKLRELRANPPAEPKVVPSNEGLAFVPSKQELKIPKMRLRGHLQGGNGEVLALLEVTGGDTYIVREGDTVGLHDLGIDSVLRIRKISRLHVVVEAGSLNQMIIVR